MAKESVDIPEGEITSEILLRWASERLQTKLGIRNAFNTMVTADNLRHFVDGMGDTNPLWRDEKYAEKTSFGVLPAPPHWFYSVFPTWVLQGLPGVHAFHSGNDWTFHLPALLGDTIKPECIFAGLEARKSEFAGKTVFEFQHDNFYNQKGALLAEASTWLVRAERHAAREKGKYRKYRLPYPWTMEELKSIENEALSYTRRGGKPRYWEGVRVGDETQTLVKGPLGLTDMIAYCVGADPVGIKAFLAALELYRKHPSWAVRDTATSALEPIYAVHYNKAVANAAGLPQPYDVGAQRQTMLLQLLTDYAGDDGWVSRNYAEYRKFFYLSDVMWLRGKVVSKYMSKDNEPCVNIESHAINQRGEDVMPGFSTVVLPSKEYDYWPIRARLSGKMGIGRRT